MPTQPPMLEPTNGLSFEFEELIAMLAAISPDGGVALSIVAAAFNSLPRSDFPR